MYQSIRRGIHRQHRKCGQFFQELSCKPVTGCLHLTSTNPRLTQAQSKHSVGRSIIQSSSVLFRAIVLHNFVNKHGSLRSYSCSYTENLDAFSDQVNTDNSSESSELAITSETESIVTSSESSELAITSGTESIVTSATETNTINDTDNIMLQELVKINLRHLQNLVACTDEELASLVASCPYLRNLEVLKHVNENVKVLLDCFKNKKKKLSYKKVKILCNQLIFIDSSALGIFLDVNVESVHTSFMNKLEEHVNKTLTNTGKVDITYLCQLLNMPQEDLKAITRETLLDFICRQYSPSCLRSKVDYLLWEGLSTTEIAFNLRLFRYTLQTLSERILDTRSHFNEISATTLYPPTLSNKRTKTQIYALLGCSKKEFSRSAKRYLDGFEAHRLYETLQMLVKLGFSKDQIRRNVFILGHEPNIVKEAFFANVGEADVTTLKGRGMLLDLMIWNLNYSS